MTSIEQLPPEAQRAIRSANVPADLRELFARLPSVIELRVDLPADVSLMPTSALQLMKLATLGARLEITDIARATVVSLELARGRRSLALGAAELALDLRVLCRRALESLFDANALTRALEAFAAESASFSAVQTLTKQMLVAADPDQALYTMLTGLTSGYGLAFNRAALFLYDEPTRTFVGSKAIGPHDAAEAHRIWEAIEYQDKNLIDLMVDHAAKNVDSRLEAFVRTLALAPGDDPDDEVSAAVASTAPVLFERREPPRNAGLARLGPAPEFVLLAITAQDEQRALVFADNVYSREAIPKERVEFLGSFVDRLALVWQNLSLLRKVEQLARFDALTGVFNRRAFEEKLREESSRSQRMGTPLSLMLIDVDRFKEVNDLHGHPAGDRLLQTLGQHLRRDLRDHDVVARLGGDEFAALLPGTAKGEAALVARRICADVKAHDISISVGVATWPDNCASVNDLVKCADEQLYEAKRQGRGRASMPA